jgi:multisubunit Na+/H+ antiporter MnhB subunit
MFVAIFAGFYAAAYIALSLLSLYFFEHRLPAFKKQSLVSVAILAVLIALVFACVALMPDIELGNRFQHMLGGGVLGVVLCYLVFRDHRIKATRFQFFIWAALIVTALGVCNELLEFLLQSQGAFVFADNPFDTWRDLASNTVGIALAAPVAALRIKRI